MKTRHLLLLLPLLWLGFSSCKRVLCANIDCEHGTCTGTECECEDGWSKDVNGRCTVQLGCNSSNCVNGTCSGQSCFCDPGWTYDADGNCTVQTPCYNVDCDHGTCNDFDGSCICDLYYMMGTDGKCSISWADSISGTYRGSHQLNFGGLVGPYDFVISADGDAGNRVTISNFANETCGSTNTPLVVGARMGSLNSMILNYSACTGVIVSGTLTRQTPTQLSVQGTVRVNTNSFSFSGVFDRL